jgi:hypothetical protein
MRLVLFRHGEDLVRGMAGFIDATRTTSSFQPSPRKPRQRCGVHDAISPHCGLTIFIGGPTRSKNGCACAFRPGESYGSMESCCDSPSSTFFSEAPRSHECLIMFFRILRFRKQVPQTVIPCHGMNMYEYRRITICTSKITTDQQLRSDGGLYGTPKISNILCWDLVSLFNFQGRRTSTNLFGFPFHQGSLSDLLSLRASHHILVQSTLVKTVPLREHKCLSFGHVLPQEFGHTFLLASNLIDLLKMSFPV